MKKLFFYGLSFFIVVTVLAGCGGVIPSPTTSTVPENGGMEQYDSKFVSLVENLNTPEKIETWLENNISYKKHDGKYTPYEFYLKKEGDCGDYTTFICYVLHHHSYEVSRMRISPNNNDTTHAFVIFQDKYGQGYDLFTPYELWTHLDTIGEWVGFMGWKLGWNTIGWTYETHPWNYFEYRNYPR